MKLVRWDQIQELVAMSNRLNRTVNDRYIPRVGDSVGAWASPVDKDDMDVRIEDGAMTMLDMYTPDTDVVLTVPKAETARPKRVEIKAR
jgi:hypothetical protein